MKKPHFLAFLWACISAIGLGFILWGCVIKDLSDLAIAIVLMLYLGFTFTIPIIVGYQKGWIQQNKDKD